MAGKKAGVLLYSSTELWLTLAEVQRTLAAMHRPDLHAAAVAVYSCGLRRSEAVDLRTQWIVADGTLLHVHDGKADADFEFPVSLRMGCWNGTKNANHVAPSIFPLGNTPVTL